MTQKSSAFSKVSLTRVTLLSSFLLRSFKVLFASLSMCLSISAFVYLLENLPPYACTAWDKISVITNLHVNFCKLSPWGLVLQASWTQCLKITQKVASNIASEARYVYIIIGQKFIWRVFENLKLEVKQCYQTQMWHFGWFLNNVHPHELWLKFWVNFIS